MKELTERKSIELAPRTKVKICGVRTSEEALAICNLHPDAIGFLVGFDQAVAANNISETQAREIVEAVNSLPEHISTFMLTWAEDAETNIHFAETIRPSHIQLTGDISPEEVIKIKETLPDLNVVKVIHVTGPEAVQKVKDYADTGALDAILLDSKFGKMTGGTGKTHDWSISKKIAEDSHLPVWLAGGLRVTNLEQAVSVARFEGVDVETGVQNPDGSKNYDLIKEFIQIAQAKQNI